MRNRVYYEEWLNAAMRYEKRQTAFSRLHSFFSCSQTTNATMRCGRGPIGGRSGTRANGRFAAASIFTVHTDVTPLLAGLYGYKDVKKYINTQFDDDN
jgi:hypothetical protein